MLVKDNRRFYRFSVHQLSVLKGQALLALLSFLSGLNKCPLPPDRHKDLDLHLTMVTNKAKLFWSS
jgi:hypothetical protein